MKKILLLTLITILPFIGFTQTFPVHDVDECLFLPSDFIDGGLNYNVQVSNPDASDSSTNVSQIQDNGLAVPGDNISRLTIELPNSLTVGSIVDWSMRFYSPTTGSNNSGAGQYQIRLFNTSVGFTSGNFVLFGNFDKTAGVWETRSGANLNLTTGDSTTDTNIANAGGFNAIFILSNRNAPVPDDLFFDNIEFNVDLNPLPLADVDADLLDGNSWVYNNRDGDNKNTFNGNIVGFNAVPTQNIATPSTDGNSATETLQIELEAGFSSFRIPIEPLDPPFSGTISYRLYNSTCTPEYNEITSITLRKDFESTTQMTSSNFTFSETNQWIEVSFDLSTLSGNPGTETGYNQLLIGFGSNAATIGNIYFVDAIQAPNLQDPVVEFVRVPEDGKYVENDNLDFVVNFDKNVDVTGTPQLDLIIGSTTVQADYFSGTGTQDLVFRYTVQANDADLDGITIDNLSLNSGTIQDASSSNNAILSLNNVDPTDKVLVFAPNFTYSTATGFQPSDPNGVTAGTDNLLIIDGVAVIGTVSDFENILVSPAGILDLDANISVAGRLYFESDATGSGQLADATGTSITGDVTVERFMSDNRAFRLAASAVTTSNFISNNWQRDTHITGTSGAANGFDETNTNSSSMFTFDNTFVDSGTPSDQSGGYSAIANTTSTNLESGTAYVLFVRGNRNVDLSSNSASSSATLSATGSLQIGRYPAVGSVPLNTEGSNWNLIANPYQSNVNYDNINKSLLSTDISVYNPSTKTYVALTSNRIINPGQSFWVQNDPAVNSGNLPELFFEENDKSTGASNTTVVFNTNQTIAADVELYRQGEDVRRDILQFRFDPNFNNGIDGNDFGKLMNNFENMGVNHSMVLSVDRRAIPESEETIPLFMNQYQVTDYEFKINLENWNNSIVVFVQDNYLNTTTLIDPTQPYAFSVDQNIPESVASDRFSLVFDNTTLGVEDNVLGSDFSLYPNPTQDGHFSIKTPNLSGEVNLEIVNLLGQQVYNNDINVESHEVNVSSENLARGVYILKLTQNDFNYTTKLIIE
jgi:hypothetical protein